MADSGPRLGWGPISFLLHLTLIVLLLLASHPTRGESSTSASPAAVLVVGSINVDIIIPVDRLPSRGETITARNPAAQVAVGGKGANQAVAAARLAAGTGRPTRFVGRFGNDSYSSMLEAALIDAGVDVSGSGRVGDSPSGQGIVLLETDGAASSVVLGGSNLHWPRGMPADHLMVDTGVVLLQREIPEQVNLAVAKAAKIAGVPVILDVGGEDRVFTKEMLGLVDYLAPNESELQRITGAVTNTEEAVVAAARTLIARGAHNVLITLAERGSLLIKEDSGVLRQEAVPVPGGVIIDGTAAGDAFRAAFAVALVETWPLQECLKFASAAGAVAVSRMGAVPSLPTRSEVLSLVSLETGAAHKSAGAHENAAAHETAENRAVGEKTSSPLSPPSTKSGGHLKWSDRSQECNNIDLDVCTTEKCTTSQPASLSTSFFPLKFASRLNSMQARPELATGNKALKTKGVLGWIARQGQVQGLDLVDFNYPQHFTEGVSHKNIKAALTAAGLSTGAVCIRFPPEYRAGAFTNPDERLRASALALAVQGCKVAAELGARDLIIWSPYDGYDYNFQIDYPTAWKWTIEAFQQLSDSCPPGVRVSLEFKPTDEATRFSIVPSTGAALLLTRDVDRPNFGLTLDVGHLLMAGENPAQSVAMVGSAGKLFGMQLNDAHVKLGAEDGLAFGSVGASAALELVAWLRKVKYDGHIYYDTFPRNEDPVREAEYNIRRFKALRARAERLEKAGIEKLTAKHDAMAILELLEADENGNRC